MSVIDGYQDSCCCCEMASFGVDDDTFYGNGYLKSTEEYFQMASDIAYDVEAKLGSSLTDVTPINLTSLQVRKIATLAATIMLGAAFIASILFLTKTVMFLVPYILIGVALGIGVCESGELLKRYDVEIADDRSRLLKELDGKSIVDQTKTLYRNRISKEQIIAYKLLGDQDAMTYATFSVLNDEVFRCAKTFRHLHVNGRQHFWDKNAKLLNHIYKTIITIGE